MLLVALVTVLVAGLPIAAWQDVSRLTADSIHRQAVDFDSVISSVRAFYSDDVVARVRSAHGKSQVTPHYRSIPGAIPIPATFSLELGHVVSAGQPNISYRFVSDFPFRGRPPHHLDAFELTALHGLRAGSEAHATDVSWNGLSTRVRYVTPIVMGASCVACHNTDPNSPKHDWKIGDVRGIQELSIVQPVASNIFSFKYLLGYLIFAAALGIGFILFQRRQAMTIAGINRELEGANEFLAAISLKISRYLSPQIYKSIFTGQTDVSIHTKRKKLTIFFSDIKDFTSTSERLQPEELTQLLNEYFTEMSTIALAYGGTIDKFVGDAILVFFGDPETLGVAEDARACLRMAVDMQRRLVGLNDEWQARGVEHPFTVRMGINTGYCNVGNFGSNDRMDYTIIGAEANLAARLQAIASTGDIIVSYETFALVRDIAIGHALPPITMKGIPHEVTPYLIERLREPAAAPATVVDRHVAGLDLRLDLGHAQSNVRETRAALEEALAALDRHTGDAL